MLKPFKQMTIADIYSQCKDLFQNNKPSFLNLLSEYFHLESYIPLTFHRAYYSYLGRDRKYSLVSMLSALILQKILGIPIVSLLIIFLLLCREAQEFYGFFDSVSDYSLFTRFKFANLYINYIYSLYICSVYNAI